MLFYHLKHIRRCPLSIAVDFKQRHHRIIIIMIIGGDIAPIPGPPKHPCGTCSKSVRSNQSAIMYDQCNQWFHTKYMNISISSYNNLSQSGDDSFRLNCSLPKFSDSFFDENVSIDVADQPQNPVQEPIIATEFEHNESKCLNKKGLHFKGR